MPRPRRARPGPLPLDGHVLALVYTRVSGREQEREGISLAQQLTECRRYAAALGWSIAAEFQDVLSGSRDDRPAYQALLAEARRLRDQGQAAAVVLLRLDRFGRKLLERVRSRAELQALGVPTHSVREGGEVSDLVANILASVAQEEVRLLGERVSDAKTHIIAGGWHHTGPPLWGYTTRAATTEERAHGAPARVLTPDPTEAPFVVEAYRRFAAGATIREVARWTATLPESARGGRTLGRQALRRILSTPLYLAQTATGQPAHWPALVSPELYAQAADRLAQHTLQPKQASGRYLLTGLIWCPRCGARLWGTPLYERRKWAGGRVVSCRAYVCWECRWQSRDVARIDEPVRAQVGAVLALAAAPSLTFRRAFARAWRALQTPPPVLPTVQRAQSERQAARAKQQLTRLALLYADGALDRQGYDLARGHAQAELDAATAALAVDPTIPTTTPLPDALTVLDWAAQWVRLDLADLPTQRAILGRLVARVVPRRTGRGQYTADLTWTPIGAALVALGELLQGAETP